MGFFTDHLITDHGFHEVQVGAFQVEKYYSLHVLETLNPNSDDYNAALDRWESTCREARFYIPRKFHVHKSGSTKATSNSLYQHQISEEHTRRVFGMQSNGNENDSSNGFMNGNASNLDNLLAPLLDELKKSPSKNMNGSSNSKAFDLPSLVFGND